MVVKPQTEIIYWFDSKNNPPKEHAKNIMNSAFAIYNANASRRGKANGPEWITVKV